MLRDQEKNFINHTRMSQTKINYYAGIGSRETPPGIEPSIEEAAGFLGRMGFVLRSGAAPGADTMFEKHCTGEMEIYLPWSKFNDNQSTLIIDDMDQEKVFSARQIARKYHPGWSYLSPAAKKLMTRNTFQVLGSDLETPVSFVVCWTIGGKISGGTGQALRIAKDLGIPIFNLFDKDALHKIKVYITNLK
jgi:hypothetical protein